MKLECDKNAYPLVLPRSHYLFMLLPVPWLQSEGHHGQTGDINGTYCIRLRPGL